MSGVPDSPSGDSEGEHRRESLADQRAAAALDAILKLEQETGQLKPGVELRRLDPEARKLLEEMLEDVHRLRRHRQALGALPTAGALLGRYRLVEVIGRGSTSTVWRALDESIQRQVAVKVLLPELGLSERQLTRFKRESTIAGRIAHPAVLALHDVGFHRGVHFIVTEYVEDGRTLTDLLAEERKALPQLANRTTARFLQQIARGLEEMHSAGIIHRDLKPANILIRPSGDPIIADLGLATLAVNDSLMTSRSGAGTPFYRSPEQVRETEHLDSRSDVFSLGVTMYELLVGRRPFDASSTQAVNDQILHLDPPAPRQVRPEIPRDLETICLHALEKDPDRRYPDAAAFAEDLDHFLHHRPIQARPASPLRRLAKLVRRRPVATMAMLSTAAVVLISAFSWVNLEAQQRKLLQSNRALMNSQLAVDRTLATAEDALAILTPGGALERSRSLGLVEAMASSAREQGTLRPMAAARQLFSAGEFAMRLGHASAAVSIFSESCTRAEAAHEIGAEGARELRVQARLSHLNALRLSHARAEARQFADAYLDDPVGTESPNQRCRFLLEAINAHSALQASDDIERLEAKHGDVEVWARQVIEELRDDAGRDASSDRLSLAASLASYLHHRHRYTEAFDIIEATFTELRDRYGLYDFRTLTAGTQLARTLNWGLLYELRETEWTRLKLATLLYPAAMETLGPEARLTVVTRWILAESLLHDQQVEEALLHYRAVREGLSPWERPDSPVMLSLETAIAVTLNALGESEEAETIYRRVAAAYAEALGPEHHDAIIPRRGLAEAFRNQGRLDEAIEEFAWQLAALLRQEDAIGRSSAVTTLWYLTELNVCSGQPDEVRRYSEQLRGLIEGNADLESKWQGATGDSLIQAAELVRIARTAGFGEAARFGERILATVGHGDASLNKWDLPAILAVSARLAAGLDAQDYLWNREPHLLVWVTLRHRGDHEAAAAYAEEHRAVIRNALREQSRTTGGYVWMLAKAIERRQATGDLPASSPIEEELVAIVMGQH